jgi:hypothetical protein
MGLGVEHCKHTDLAAASQQTDQDNLRWTNKQQPDRNGRGLQGVVQR